MKHANLAILVVFLFITLWTLGTRTAGARVLRDLKGWDEIYGTYAPNGDCQHEPRIRIDATGFTYTYRGRTTHPAAVVNPTTAFAPTADNPNGGDPDRAMFFPFPSGLSEDKWGNLQAADFGPLNLVTDSKTHAIAVDAGGTRKIPAGATPLQAALVQNSPYATCGTHIATPAHAGAQPVTYPLRINFGGEGEVKPTRAQDAALHRAAGRYLRPTGNPRQGPYTMTVADLNDDGRKDLFITFNNPEFCGQGGCSGAIVMATPNGYAHSAILMPRFYGAIHILPGKHGGMHDMQFNDGPGPVWQWNGHAYVKANTGHADSGGGPTWQVRKAGPVTMAAVVARDSVIKDVSVFCNQGKPVLAMLVKARPPTNEVTLTFLFGSHQEDVPMGPANAEAKLWLSDLSRSDLPLWLAHRGSTAASTAELRINGGRQGEISLVDSTAATQTALGNCYHY